VDEEPLAELDGLGPQPVAALVGIGLAVVGDQAFHLERLQDPEDVVLLKIQRRRDLGHPDAVRGTRCDEGEDPHPSGERLDHVLFGCFRHLLSELLLGTRPIPPILISILDVPKSLSNTS